MSKKAMTEEEFKYQLSLIFVDWVGCRTRDHTTSRFCYFTDSHGRTLKNVGEVVIAIIAGHWPVSLPEVSFRSTIVRRAPVVARKQDKIYASQIVRRTGSSQDFWRRNTMELDEAVRAIGIFRGSQVGAEFAESFYIFKEILYPHPKNEWDSHGNGTEGGR